MDQTVFKLLISDVQRRLFAENKPRIINCLARLSEEQVWWRPNDHSNSIGHLLLHLSGNVRQYVLSGLFGLKDGRQRNLEFNPSQPLSKSSLLAIIVATLDEVEVRLPSLTPEQAIPGRTVQGFDENGIGILVHVTEHFSYHVGQIAYITKLLTDEDLAFYGDLDLNVTQ